MPKQAISVSLEASNLVWMHARVRTARARSVSELLDRLIQEARQNKRGAGNEPRSVAAA